jgi:hypothetical protein
MGTKQFDFTEFTIADTDAEISAIASTMSWLELQTRIIEEKTGSLAYNLLSDDDLEITFGLNYANIDRGGGVYQVANFFMSDTLHDMTDFNDYNGVRVRIVDSSVTPNRIDLTVNEGKEDPGSIEQETYSIGSTPFTGYPTINYTAGAGTFSKGLYVMGLYSDAGRTNLLTTLTVNAEHLTLLQMLNFVIVPAGLHNASSPNPNIHGDGYTEDLIFIGDGVAGGSTLLLDGHGMDGNSLGGNLGLMTG